MQKQHPTVDIQPHLAHASQPFRRFILNQLENMAKVGACVCPLRREKIACSQSLLALHHDHQREEQAVRLTASSGSSAATSSAKATATTTNTTATGADSGALQSRLRQLQARYNISGGGAAGASSSKGSGGEATTPSKRGGQKGSGDATQAATGGGAGVADGSTTGTGGFTMAAKYRSPPGGAEGEALGNATAHNAGSTNNAVSARDTLKVRGGVWLCDGCSGCSCCWVACAGTEGQAEGHSWQCWHSECQASSRQQQQQRDGGR